MRSRKKYSMLSGMDKVQEAYEALRERVLALRDKETGVWTGELAPSALGTALAAVALETGEAPDRALAESGASWLAAHANADGGWGDTPDSVSNLSTTLIAAAAVRRMLRVRSEELGVRSWGGIPGERILETRGVEALQRAEAWITARAGSMESGAIAQALGKVYGEDRTFAVPILAYLAMCGDNGRAWLSVPPLPFLLALLPHWLYRFCRLQVVSYALPLVIRLPGRGESCGRVAGLRADKREGVSPVCQERVQRVAVAAVDRDSERDRIAHGITLPKPAACAVCGACHTTAATKPERRRMLTQCQLSVLTIFFISWLFHYSLTVPSLRAKKLSSVLHRVNLKSRAHPRFIRGYISDAFPEKIQYA